MGSPRGGSYREVWDLAYPAIITMVSQTVMWTVDSAMVGHVGKAELAAVGLGGLYVFTLYSFFIGLSYSLNTFVSQSMGAGHHARCGRYLWQGLYLGWASSLCILGLRAFNPLTVGLLGPSVEVRPLCVTYMDIRMLGVPFFISHYYLSNFFRGIGNTRTPMNVAIVANLVNIVLDFFLIFGHGPFPTLGVAGAAWATFIANTVAAAILAAVCLTPAYRSRFDILRQWRMRWDATRGLLRIGLPIGLHYFLDIGSFLIFSAYIARMGTEALAANQIIIQTLAWSFMPLSGLSVAATTLVGQYIGAERPDLATRSGYRSLHLGLLFSALVAVVYLSIPEHIVRLFNADPRVIAFGRQTIAFAAAFQVFDGVQIVTSGALRGAGDTRVPMLLALGGGWLLFLPLAYLLGTGMGWGLRGAWGGATAYVVFLAVAMFLRFKMGAWRSIRLDGAQEPAGASS